jgi:hypothetical protein
MTLVYTAELSKGKYLLEIKIVLETPSFLWLSKK